MHQDYIEVPENLSEELQAKVNYWRDLIIDSSKINNEPQNPFKSVSYEEFLLPRLTSELKVEAENRKDELKEFETLLTKQCYEKQLYKDMTNIYAMQNLEQDESTTIYSSDMRDIVVFRVWGGFIYATYISINGVKKLADTKPVPCMPEEIQGFFDGMIKDTTDAYHPYLSASDCSRISQQAWLDLNESDIFQ